MRAMVLHAQGKPLSLEELPMPLPGPGQLRIRVNACAVCRTDLHVMDGDLKEPKLPLILGHEIVGLLDALGPGVEELGIGQRVGVPWLGWTCGRCDYCRSGQENLCASARFTGYHLDGGYAEYALADARYAFPIPEAFSDSEAAPLLCAGLIGFRSYRMCGEARRIGLYGFGAAAHLLCQLAVQEGREVYAFAKAGDLGTLDFARQLGASWAGSSVESPPEELDAAILFAPVGALVPAALSAVRRGGTVVCGGIHMSEIPAFPYELLWGERVLRSVANLTRQDGQDFFRRMGSLMIRSHVVPYPLERANEALADLRAGRLQGAAVLESFHE